MSQEIGSIHGSIEITDNGTPKVKEFKTQLGGVADVAKGVVIGLTGFNGLSWALGQVTTTVKDSVSNFTSFEEAMARTATLADDGSLSIRALESGVRDLAQAYGMDAGGLAAGLNQVLQSGVQAGEAMEFLETSAKGSLAGAGSLSDVINILDNTLDAFGLTAKDAKGVMDQLFAASKAGETPVTGLTQAMAKLGPLASSVGLSLSETLAVLTSLTKQGVQAEDATASLRIILAELADSQSNVNKTLGIEGVKSAGDFTRALEKIRVAVGGRTDNAIALFGDSARGLTGVLKLANTGAEDFAAGLDAINRSAGEADRRLGLVKDTTAQMMREAKSSWDDFKISIGEFLAREWLRLQALIAYTSGNTKLYSHIAAQVGTKGEIGGGYTGYEQSVSKMTEEQMFGERNKITAKIKQAGTYNSLTSHITSAEHAAYLDELNTKLSIVEKNLQAIEETEMSASKATAERAKRQKENAEFWAGQSQKESAARIKSAKEQEEIDKKEAERQAKEKADHDAMLDDKYAKEEQVRQIGEERAIKAAEVKGQVEVELHQFAAEQWKSMADNENRSIEERKGAWMRYGYERRAMMKADMEFKLAMLEKEYQAEKDKIGGDKAAQANLLAWYQASTTQIAQMYNDRVAAMSVSMDVSVATVSMWDKAAETITAFSSAVQAFGGFLRELESGGRFGKSGGYNDLSNIYAGAGGVESALSGSNNPILNMVGDWAGALKLGLDIGSMLDAGDRAAAEAEKHWRAVRDDTAEAAGNIIKASDEWLKSMGLGDAQGYSKNELAAASQQIQSRQYADVRSGTGINFNDNQMAVIQNRGMNWLWDLVSGQVEPQGHFEASIQRSMWDKWGMDNWSSSTETQRRGVSADMLLIDQTLFTGPLAEQRSSLLSAIQNYQFGVAPDPSKAGSWQGAQSALSLQRTLQGWDDNKYAIELWNLAQNWKNDINPFDWLTMQRNYNNATSTSVAPASSTGGIPELDAGGMAYGPSIAGEVPGHPELVLPMSDMARTDQLLNTYLGMSAGGGDGFAFNINLKIDPNIPFNQDSTRQLAKALSDQLVISRTARGRRGL